ncbi:MAG: hypothetical protein ACE5HK_08305 [Candidatus Methylomirabilales bacterium]
MPERTGSRGEKLGHCGNARRAIAPRLIGKSPGAGSGISLIFICCAAGYISPVAWSVSSNLSLVEARSG